MPDHRTETNSRSSAGGPITPSEHEKVYRELPLGLDAEDVAQNVDCHPKTLQASDDSQLTEEFDVALEEARQAIGKMMADLKYEKETYEKRLTRLKMHRLEMLLVDARKLLTYPPLPRERIALWGKAYVRQLMEEIQVETNGGKEQ